MIYGKDHGKEGLLQIGGNINDTQIYDQQIWKFLKSHSSYLEITPTSIYDEEINMVLFWLFFDLEQRNEQLAYHNWESSLPGAILPGHWRMPNGVIPGPGQFTTIPSLSIPFIAE